MSTYTDSLNNLAETIKALPETTPYRDEMVAMIPRLVPGEWITAEYVLTHYLSKAAATPSPALNDVAVAIGQVRNAAWHDALDHFTKS